jgi:hypothetical protein
MERFIFVLLSEPLEMSAQNYLSSTRSVPKYLELKGKYCSQPLYS